MVCSKCGANLSDDAKFCEECGARVEIPVQPVVEEVKQPENDIYVENFANSSNEVGTVINGYEKKKKSKAPMIIALASICTVLLVGIIAAICIFVSNSGSKAGTEAARKALAQKEAYENGYVLYSSEEAINDAYSHTLIKISDQSTYKLSVIAEYVRDAQLLNNGQGVLYATYWEDRLFYEDMTTHDLTLIAEEVDEYFVNSTNDAVFYYTNSNELIMYDFSICQTVADGVIHFYHNDDKILYVKQNGQVYLMEANTKLSRQIVNFNYDADKVDFKYILYSSEDFSNIYILCVDDDSNYYIYTNKGYSAEINSKKQIYDVASTEDGKVYISLYDDNKMTFDLYCFDGKEGGYLISNTGEITLSYIEYSGVDVVSTVTDNSTVIFRNGKKYIVDAYDDEAHYSWLSMDGSIMYYIYFNGEYCQLYKLDVTTNKKVLLSDHFNPLDDFGALLSLSGSSLLYLANAEELEDEYTGVGDLYYNDVKIDTDVCSEKAIIEEDIIYYTKNYNVNTEIYDLYMYKDGKSQKIFTDVSDFRSNDDSIIFVECIDGGYTDVYMIVNNKKVLIINDMSDDYYYSKEIVMSGN